MPMSWSWTSVVFKSVRKHISAVEDSLSIVFLTVAYGLSEFPSTPTQRRSNSEASKHPCVFNIRTCPGATDEPHLSRDRTTLPTALSSNFHWPDQELRAGERRYWGLQWLASKAQHKGSGSGGCRKRKVSSFLKLMQPDSCFPPSLSLLLWYSSQ